MSRKNEKWTTYDEIKFINKLGYNKNKKGRLESLKKYKVNLFKRVEFGDIDRNEIIKHINSEIRMEEGR